MARDALLERLLSAADRMAFARGEAQWTDGYRAAKGFRDNDPEGERMYEKSRGQWTHVGRVEGRARRAFLTVLRQARKQIVRPTVRRRRSRKEGR